MTSTLQFRDVLYGQISLPEWLRPALSLPEFARLRGVRQSNLDGFEHKDFASPSRWSHALGAAYLATTYAAERSLDKESATKLILATLLHDVATPPFAHTAEQALAGFDHESETFRVLAGASSALSHPSFPVFLSELGQFGKVCKKIGRDVGIKLDPASVAELVVGQGELGYLVSGTIDLDNADNVTRALLYLGEPVDRTLPIRLAKWLARRSERPLEIRTIDEPDLQEWIRYKDTLYALFYYATADEIGRQAFLEHLMRRAINEGLPAETLLWSTDEGLLDRLHDFTATINGRPTLRTLASQYRLLDAPKLLATLPLGDAAARLASNPEALYYMEESLSERGHEVCITVQRPRFKLSPAVIASIGKFVDEPVPRLYAFVVAGRPAKESATETDTGLSVTAGRGTPQRRATEKLTRLIQEWSDDKPWIGDDSVRKTRNVTAALDSVGDWSFRLTRNESIHTYPGTFVHALPSALIRALGLRGSRIVDPFCGTGQTATAALRTRAVAYLADVNQIALLVASARFSYLTTADRHFIRSLTIETCKAQAPQKVDYLPDVRSWHHPQTVIRLRQLLSLVTASPSASVTLMLKATFSAILTSTTARKGKQHGFFADNTPLPKGSDAPPYVDPFPLFVSRLRRNLDIVERMYAELESDGRDPAAELANVKIVRADARTLCSSQLDLKDHEVDAVVTSPPYLGAADYSLGNRLSYYWLFPEAMAEDFQAEVGARRRRFRADVALESYLKDLAQFAGSAAQLLRDGGLLVTILGESSAVAFKSSGVIERIETEWKSCGFEPLWHKWREVHWHRNHGYERIRTERIGVYRLALG